MGAQFVSTKIIFNQMTQSKISLFCRLLEMLFVYTVMVHVQSDSQSSFMQHFCFQN